MVEEMVIEALEEQVECYRRLQKLAQRQHEFVQQSDTEGLIEVLEQRQGEVSRIMELEEQLAESKRLWKQGGRVEPRAEVLLAETKSLLERITSADRDDAMVLQQRKLTLGRQIKAASAARQVNRTYAVAAYGQRSARIDDRG
jgi:hypothetical protein